MKFTKENVDRIIAEAIQFKLTNYDEEEYRKQLRFCAYNTIKNVYCFEYHRRHPGGMKALRKKAKELNAL